MRARSFAPLGRHQLRISFLLTAVTWSLATALAAPNAIAQPAPLARYYTQTTDLVGNPISSVNVGEQFKLDVFVQDMRDPQTNSVLGVFQGTTKVTFDDSLTPVALPPDFQIDWYFSLGELFAIAPDAVIVSGTSTSLQSPGNDPQKLFSLVFEATTPGVQVFLPTFYETLDHFTLLYGTDTEAKAISFQGSTLSVVPEPSSVVLVVIAAAALWPLARRGRQRP